MVVARVVDDQHANADANARLIAAAPDLLAACRCLLASLVDWCDLADEDDQRAEDYRAIDAAKAAIATAEGRE
jgi:hypothetical protein